VFSSRIVLRRAARAVVEQRDNFVHRQRMSFSLGADVLSNAARQVAAHLDLVRESYDRRESWSCPDPDRLREVFPNSIEIALEIYRVCFSSNCPAQWKIFAPGSHWQDSQSIPHEGSGIASPVGS
jgi:hypothetical protein